MFATAKETGPPPMPQPPATRPPSSDGNPVSHCYICLGTEGEMLVNVCACKWSRVHVHCLESLQKVNDKCGVCKEVFNHATEKKSLTAQMWEQ